MTRQAFNYICAKAGKQTGLNIKVYPHMLRHSCGFALANKGCDTRLIQDFLGHRNYPPYPTLYADGSDKV